MSDESHVDHNIPMFNKNAFSSNGTVVITTAARIVMAKNGHTRPNSARSPLTIGDAEADHQLTKGELHAMRCVVEGLRLMHRDRSYTKEVLSHCITQETYGPNECVRKKDWEQQLSCHFIVSGSVMVTYELDKDVMEKGSKPDANETTQIVYTHGAGEYLAMLSLEGIEDDIAPPSTVFTLEPTDFLRIDRIDFHQRLNLMVSKLREEIKQVLHNPDCILSAVPDEAMEKILPHVTRQHYPPQHVILKQGDQSNVMFFIAKGRCQLTRMVSVLEARKNVCFHMGFVEQYGCYGQECLLQSSPSLCTATSTSPTLVLKINRQALQVVIKDHLHNILDRNFQGYTSDQELQHTGYHACVWDEFKYSQIRQHLMEVGALGLLLPHTSEGIQRMPMPPEERHKENLRRFLLHGANFEPVTRRIRSAYIRRPVRLDVIASDKERRRVKPASSSHRTVSVQSRDVTSASSSRANIGHTSCSRPSSSSVGNVGDECDKKEFEDQDSLQDNNDVFISKIQATDNSVPQENRGDPSQLPDMQNNSNFMKAAVMVTLTTKDIVKKAKAAAKKKGLEAPSVAKPVSDSDDGRWYTSIHEEHDRLASRIARDKQRTAYIRIYLDARAKERQNRAGYAPGDENTNNDINTNTIVHLDTSTTTQSLQSGSDENCVGLDKQNLSGQNEEIVESSIPCGTISEDEARKMNSFHKKLKTQMPEEDIERLKVSSSIQSNLVQIKETKQFDKHTRMIDVNPTLIKEEHHQPSERREFHSKASFVEPQTVSSPSGMPSMFPLKSDPRDGDNTKTMPSVRFTSGSRDHGWDPSCRKIQLRPVSAPVLLPASSHAKGRSNDEVTIISLQSH